MPEFEIRAFQGLGATFVITLSAPVFLGSEVLVARVGRGDTFAPLLTVAPTWVPGQTPGAFQHVYLPFSAADLALLTPDSYSVLISQLDSTSALATGLLEVYAAPSGLPPPYYRSLATPAKAQSALPELSRQQIDTLGFNLVAATHTIETYVNRPLVLDSYDHFIRPNGRFRLKLRTKPVVELTRVNTDVVPGVTVKNNGTGLLSNATMTTIVASPKSMQITSLIFTTTSAGVATPQTLTMSNYKTMADLQSAINALGNGWVASTQPPLAGLPVADAFGTPGVQNCLNQDIWIHTHDMPLGQFWLEPAQGWVEINEPIPGGFLIPNPRVERTDTRYWGVRFTYRAGYAVDQADIDLGYYPVPEDLQQCCIATAYNLIELTPFAGPVQSQTVKDRSYVLKVAHSVIPEAFRVVLAKYIDVVF